MAKTGDLLKQHDDWTDEIARITAPTVLVFADADATRPAPIVEFFALLGGELGDAASTALPASRLAILPGTTHDDVLFSPRLAPAVIPFPDTPAPQDRRAPGSTSVPT